MVRFLASSDLLVTLTMIVWPYVTGPEQARPGWWGWLIIAWWTLTILLCLAVLL